MRVRVLFLASLLTSLLPIASAQAQQNAPLTSPEERALLHNSPEWQQIASHLPNPASADEAALETAGDVLRARRFPEDALDYYGYAIEHGGNVDRLLNKMGVVRLELRQDALARQMFLRVVRANKKNSQAWNNLGVTEYASRDYVGAITDYKRAVRLNRQSAVYHSNLGMAYFERDDLQSAREQFAVALRLDPTIMQERDAGGMTAHILDTQNYPELCFELAKLSARTQDPVSMRLWLAKASEGGFDVREGMREDVVLRPYLNDPQIQLMLANSAQLRKRSVATTAAPGLGAADGAQHLDID